VNQVLGPGLQTGTDVMIKNYFAKKWRKLAILIKITLLFWQKKSSNKKNGKFFSEHWKKIVENCDHNIDPW
jgi:hypothetical protein